MGRLRRPYSHLALTQSICPTCGNYLHTEVIRVSADKGQTWKSIETHTCLRRRANPPTARCCNKRTVTTHCNKVAELGDG